MTELKSFHCENLCPKCGQKEADVLWEGEVPIADATDEYAMVRDMIKRTCTRCGYSWHELPLDAKQ